MTTKTDAHQPDSSQSFKNIGTASGMTHYQRHGSLSVKNRRVEAFIRGKSLDA